MNINRATQEPPQMAYLYAQHLHVGKILRGVCFVAGVGSTARGTFGSPFAATALRASAATTSVLDSAGRSLEPLEPLNP